MGSLVGAWDIKVNVDCSRGDTRLRLNLDRSPLRQLCWRSNTAPRPDGRNFDLAGGKWISASQFGLAPRPQSS
jgi:hypothetical protein